MISSNWSLEPNTLLKNSFLSENFRSTGHIKKRKNIFSSLIMKGFQQGTDLSQLAKSLKMKVNPGFKKLIFVNETANSIRLKHLNFEILGPTKKNLDKLKEEWKDWVTKKRRNVKSEIGLFQLLDKSVPNLASIVFLAELKNRRILFTGDGIGDDILKVLSENTKLDNNGKFHIDILKVPHHGSARNASIKFFDTVYADYYIISANGRDDNPSPGTLKWIIESNNNPKNPKKIIMTNMTPGIRKFLRKYDQKKFNYHCVFLEKNENFITIKLQ